MLDLLSVAIAVDIAEHRRVVVRPLADEDAQWVAACQAGDELAWSKTLLAPHANLKAKGKAGLAGWLDCSAIPKNQNGTSYPLNVADYPVAETVEDRIVKTPPSDMASMAFLTWVAA